METEKFDQLMDVINDFVNETGYPRDEIAIICSDKDELATLKIQNIAGVEIFPHVSMMEDCVGLVHVDLLPFIDEYVEEMGPDPWGWVIEEGEPESKIQSCVFCGHPINLIVSADFENVTCPWCNKVNTPAGN